MITHGIDSKQLVIKIPAFTYPSDAEIRESMVKFKDKGEWEVIDWVQGKLPLDLLSTIWKKYPDDDKKFMFFTEEQLETNRNITSDSFIIPSVGTYNFNKWKPFQYPIMKFTEKQRDTILGVAYSITKEIPMNAIRYAIPIVLTKNENFKMSMPFDAHMVEGLVINSILPKEIKILNNENPMTIVPCRNYVSFGMMMVKSCSYVEQELAFEFTAKELKFDLICWFFRDEYQLEKLHILTQFEEESTRKTLKMEYANNKISYIR